MSSRISSNVSFSLRALTNLLSHLIVNGVLLSEYMEEVDGLIEPLLDLLHLVLVENLIESIRLLLQRVARELNGGENEL